MGFFLFSNICNLCYKTDEKMINKTAKNENILHQKSTYLAVIIFGSSKRLSQWFPTGENLDTAWGECG